VQPEFAAHRFELGGLDQLAMRDAHRMQRALELLLPEGQEAVQFGKFGEQIVGYLPPMAGSKFWKPLIFPPGRPRLATKPLSTGSETWVNTTGIVL
jgi:hypothetical protein